MNTKLIAILVATVVLLAGGWYVSSLRADNKELRGQVTQLEADTDQLRLLAAKAGRTTTEATKAAQEARAQAGAASKGIQEARNDKDTDDWYNSPLPSGVRDALAR